MPKCFDWRNVNGTNYDTPIKRQGDCGSCYAVAMLSAVESRIRISTNNVD
jgi:C1A family cysteine protease